MSQQAMPLIIVNLGCEMVYILEQRLKAQNISVDKSVKVLNDVVRTMFDKAYLEKLFTPQDICSISSTKKIFDRLAHSSIMRLNDTSMDKLFDLIIMGLKYQVVCAKSLDDMVQATYLHLRTVKAIVSEVADASVLELIANAEEHIKKHYSGLTLGQLFLLRQTLFRFFQDKRVKVSLFLKEGIQTMNGKLFIPSPISPEVGKAAYYGPSGAIDSEEKLTLSISKQDPSNFFVHPCPLGTNLYSKDRPKVTPPVRKGDLMGAPINVSESSKKGSLVYADDLASTGGDGARKELDLLSALLAMPKPLGDDNFKLNLFGDNDDEFVTAPVVSAGGSVPTYKFGTDDKNKEYKNKSLGGVMKSLNMDDKAGDDADLLSLMDDASK